MDASRKKIQEIIKQLTQTDKEQLRLAHNYGVAQYVKLPNGHFVGVHLNGVPNLTIECEYNDWYFGIINHGTAKAVN
jgi:hypothetical protein